MEKLGERRFTYKQITLIFVFTAIFLFLLTVNSSATSFIEDSVSSNSALLYNRYPLSNYALCYSSSDKGLFEFFDKTVSYAVYAIANILWTLTYLICYGMGSLLSEAFSFSFLDNVTGVISDMVQSLLGINSGGVRSNGLFITIVLFAIAALGLFLVYKGLMKRETSSVLGKVMSFILVFALIVGFTVNAQDFISKINEFSNGLQNEVMRVGLQFTGGNNAGSGANDSAQLVRDNIFRVQIYEPWKELNFDRDKDFSDDTAEEILSYASSDETRQKKVDSLVEADSASQIGAMGQTDRVGKTLLLFIVNFAISLCIGYLAIFSIVAQLDLVVSLIFFPLSICISLFPSQESKTYQSVKKVFNALLSRIAISLVLVSCCILSTMIYRLDSVLNLPFFVQMIFQLMVWCVGCWKLPDFMKMFGLSGSFATMGSGFLQKTGRRFARRRFFRGGRSFQNQKEKSEKENVSPDRKKRENVSSDEGNSTGRKSENRRERTAKDKTYYNEHTDNRNEDVKKRDFNRLDNEPLSDERHKKEFNRSDNKPLSDEKQKRERSHAKNFSANEVKQPNKQSYTDKSYSDEEYLRNRNRNTSQDNRKQRPVIRDVDSSKRAGKERGRILHQFKRGERE